MAVILRVGTRASKTWERIPNLSALIQALLILGGVNNLGHWD